MNIFHDYKVMLKLILVYRIFLLFFFLLTLLDKFIQMLYLFFSNKECKRSKRQCCGYLH